VSGLPALIPSSFLARRMPLVLMALTVLAATFGDISTCAGLSVFGFGTLATSAADLFGAPFTAFALLVLICGGLELVLAFGFSGRRRWAWPLGVTVESALLALSLGWVLVGALVGLQIIRALVSLLILSALGRSEVRAALEGADGDHVELTAKMAG
jgi:hypothetical protein